MINKKYKDLFELEKFKEIFTYKPTAWKNNRGEILLK